MRRKGRHWSWLTRQPDGTVTQVGGMPVTPKALAKWDREAAHKLNRADRQAAKQQIRQEEP